MSKKQAEKERQTYIRDLKIGIGIMIAGTSIILLWALGKAFGLINSPEWIKMVPYFGAIGVLAGLAKILWQASYSLGSLDQRVKSVEYNVKQLKQDTREIEKRVVNIEAHLF